METKKLNRILNFIVKMTCALGIIGISVLMLLNSNAFGEATTATLLTFSIGALGVSIGYNSKETKEVKNG